MTKPLWEHYFNNWQGAVEILNNVEWNLTWKEYEGQWYLWSGEALLFVAKTQNELQAFLCGMGISLAVLPDELLEE